MIRIMALEKTHYGNFQEMWLKMLTFNGERGWKQKSGNRWTNGVGDEPNDERQFYFYILRKLFFMSDNYFFRINYAFEKVNQVWFRVRYNPRLQKIGIHKILLGD